MANISFGRIVVVTAGTPVRLTANQIDPTAAVHVHAILIQPYFGNTGRTYIGNSASFVKNSTGMIAWLPVPSTTSAPAFSETVSYAINAVEANEFWVDADNNGDSVIAAAIVG